MFTRQYDGQSAVVFTFTTVSQRVLISLPVSVPVSLRWTDKFNTQPNSINGSADDADLPSEDSPLCEQPKVCNAVQKLHFMVFHFSLVSLSYFCTKTK